MHIMNQDISCGYRHLHILCNTNSVAFPIRKWRTQSWVDHHTRSENANRSLFCPVIQAIPVDAFMWTLKVPKRNCLILAPTHREERCISLALYALAENVETVVFRVSFFLNLHYLSVFLLTVMLKIVRFLLLCGIGEIVIRKLLWCRRFCPKSDLFSFLLLEGWLAMQCSWW